MLGGHRELEPLLPIPNRTVKRLIANDSMLFACESRSLPSFLTLKNPNLKFKLRVFYCLKFKQIFKGRCLQNEPILITPYKNIILRNKPKFIYEGAISLVDILKAMLKHAYLLTIFNKWFYRVFIHVGHKAIKRQCSYIWFLVKC